MKFMITGGAGFIGSAVIRHLINYTDYSLVNVDKLTYAGNLDTLKNIESNNRYFFEKEDICSLKSMSDILNKHKPNIIIHLAAETHVDRSIDTPEQFINTNIYGTYSMLEAAKKYWNNLSEIKKNQFKFLHVSTDEVYGDLGNTNLYFTEKTPYAPSSPYSASKAGSDHLVRAWKRTFKLPTLITNCSNNYGPYQFPEKLIPLTILNALEGKNLPIYGNGKQIRDWIFVEDHAGALIEVAINGKVGETYNIGGYNEIQNIDVVKNICKIMDRVAPSKLQSVKNYEKLITFVEDRAGHDLRYAIDSSKVFKELNWKPKETFLSGLKKTVNWYLNNLDWCHRVKKNNYDGKRLGLISK